MDKYDLVLRLPVLVIVAIGLAFGNIAYQLPKKRPVEKAFDRIYHQTMALLVLYIVLVLDQRFP